jgi:peptide/nickel transport system substrate-binding protein
MRLVRLGIVFALALGLVTGIRNAPSQAAAAHPASTISVLRIGDVTSYSTLDDTKDNEAQILDDLSLDTLYTYNTQGRLVPDLATSVTHPNAVTYVYHVRRGVKFWDGTQLTASDVVYSLNYQRAAGSRMSFFYSSVKSITAAGAYLVIVTLAYPNASWPANLPWTFVFEKKYALQHKATFGEPGTLLVGSGPWEVSKLDPTSGASFSANPHWWRGTVPIKRIQFSFFASESSLALAMRAGSIDMDDSVSNIRPFAATSGAKVLTAENPLSFYVIELNTKVAPWNDVHVRRAVAYAMNRSDLVTAHGGYASPVYTLIPPQSLLSIASRAQVSGLMGRINLYPHDLTKAKEEMAKSKYRRGVNTTLYEFEPGEPANVSQVIAAELGQIGIHVQVKVAGSIGSWINAETGPARGRISTYVSNGSASLDPSSYLEFLLGSWNTTVGSWNISQYAPATVDKLIKAGIGTTNDGKRFGIYSTLLKRLSIDVPIVPILLADSAIALSKKFACPTFGPYLFPGPWALQIKPAK